MEQAVLHSREARPDQLLRLRQGGAERVEVALDQRREEAHQDDARDLIGQLIGRLIQP